MSEKQKLDMACKEFSRAVVNETLREKADKEWELAIKSGVVRGGSKDKSDKRWRR